MSFEKIYCFNSQCISALAFIRCLLVDNEKTTAYKDRFLLLLTSPQFHSPSLFLTFLPCPGARVADSEAWVQGQGGSLLPGVVWELDPPLRPSIRSGSGGAGGMVGGVGSPPGLRPLPGAKGFWGPGDSGGRVRGRPRPLGGGPPCVSGPDSQHCHSQVPGGPV